MDFLAGDLPFDRRPGTERHGHELSDVAVTGVDAVEPRLLG